MFPYFSSPSSSKIKNQPPNPNRWTVGFVVDAGSNTSGLPSDQISVEPLTNQKKGSEKLFESVSRFFSTTIDHHLNVVTDDRPKRRPTTTRSLSIYRTISTLVSSHAEYSTIQYNTITLTCDRSSVPFLLLLLKEYYHGYPCDLGFLTFLAETMFQKNRIGHRYSSIC
jgi:hypothetical protein